MSACRRRRDASKEGKLLRRMTAPVHQRNKQTDAGRVGEHRRHLGEFRINAHRTSLTTMPVRHIWKRFARERSDRTRRTSPSSLALADRRDCRPWPHANTRHTMSPTRRGRWCAGSGARSVRRSAAVGSGAHWQRWNAGSSMTSGSAARMPTARRAACRGTVGYRTETAAFGSADSPYRAGDAGGVTIQATDCERASSRPNA